MEDTKNTQPIEQTTPEQPLFYDNPEKQPEPIQNNPEKQPSDNKPSPQESFQEIRRKTEQLQRERDEALRVLHEQREYILAQQQAQQPKQEQEQPLDDDDYIEAKRFKSEINSLRSEINQYKQQQQSTSIEMQLRNKYNDFDKVMTYENIAKLRELRPEIAQSLHHTPDLYNKASATYTILKEMGIYQSETYSPEKDRSDYNQQKPKPTATLQRGDSPLSHVGEFRSNLSEDRKKEIWRQMQTNIK